MNSRLLCLVSGIIVAASACSKLDHAQANNTDEFTVELKSPADVFDEKNAELINCLEMGLLSELGIGAGKGCGQIDKTGLVKFTSEFMALDFVAPGEKTTCLPIYRDGLADEYKRFGQFFITSEGYGRGHNEHYDFDCDRWESLPDIAKTYVNGKLAYMDKSMMILHLSDFPFGENFSTETNLAIVCSEPPRKRLGPHKEHFAYLGGKCGQINSDFEVVTKVEQPFESFRPLPIWAIPFYTRDAEIITKPGKAKELQLILREALQDLPGLTSVEVYGNMHDPNLVFVRERWASRAAHAGSLKMPKVQAAIQQGRPLIESINQSEYEYDPENGKY